MKSFLEEYWWIMALIGTGISGFFILMSKDQNLNSYFKEILTSFGY